MYDAEHPYNPLAVDSIAHSVETTLLQQRPTPMDQIERFTGSGIYLLYYCGGHREYTKISSIKCKVPIYVGKASSKGGRQGISEQRKTDTQLYGRLRDHVGSIKAAKDLDIKDFRCRFLVVEDLFIGLGEQIAIRHFRPVWNQALSGFGSHGQGKGRYEGKRSDWDVMHPGRVAADRQQPGRTRKEVLAGLRAHFTA